MKLFFFFFFSKCGRANTVLRLHLGAPMETNNKVHATLVHSSVPYSVAFRKIKYMW